MRYQGRITEWKDDRGFGFVTPNGANTKVFLHISAFRHGQRRPAGNELVTYELLSDEAKGPRARDVAFVEARRPSGKGQKQGMPGAWKPAIAALLLIALAVFGWQRFASKQDIPHAASSGNPFAIGQSLQVTKTTSEPAFRCEGKRFCSQMQSCEEAMFYQKNCPDTKIDGDHDGIPCEQQCSGTNQANWLR